MMPKLKMFLATSTALGLAMIAAAVYAQSPKNKEIVNELKGSFSERGIAKLDRLDQTELQALCSAANESRKPLPAKVKAGIEKKILASIPYPADGAYLGDWKEGEKIAQNGRGMQFTDAAGVPNGANCYACHQITPSEISFGNQGPSLLKYGLLRGVKDPSSQDAEVIVKYTWARIWNTHAFNACSGMPRFGDAGILTPAQIKDVMALLLDPASPVNK